MADDYRFSTTPPEWVNELSRDYKEGAGTVVSEVGVLEENDSGETSWKVLQLIEMDDGSSEIRGGYYTKTGGWRNKPLMLPPDIMEDLIQFADGKLW
ncbi:hypothetical protein SAMN05216226_11821 [Halovenus aranensis]|uniref:Uncharacterized protein n=1 Tax=Halovenus aranensis TaxID=890420 RepID=A0A1G8Z5A4_9EURY|nr:hypothetical protein [Halovenus aranensis]SDK10236.1 hypothetical protein SAMN05216226_11821 [Halovenus aranensis]